MLGAPSEPTIAAGLKEALQIGAERSVSRAARPGGFLDDPRVRIPLPPQLDKLARGLRALGFHGAVDELEVAMNRAAERAAREAQGPLVAAVAGLQIADARAILSGPDDAATQYLRRASGDALRERFAPVVASAMRGTGVHRAYEELRSRNRVLALLEDPTRRSRALCHRRDARRAVHADPRRGAADPQRPRRAHHRAAARGVRPAITRDSHGRVHSTSLGHFDGAAERI